MSQPPAYVPVHAFVADSATLSGFPGQALDVEFQDIKTTTDAIRTNLALIQRDDGPLANGVVTYDSLSSGLQTAGLTPAVPWATSVAYAAGFSVVQSSALYRCLVAHTSGVFATDLAAGKWLFISNLALFDGSSATFKQPASYPINVTSGHNIPYTDSDAQFGNSYSQYPLGAVSANPLIIGKAGCSIGSTTQGQTFKIVFTSSGLSGSPITITYTAGAAETTTTIAAGLAALVNANSVLHGLGGKPIFMQPLGGGVFNLQYDDAFGATGATPLTTATTGSTGTITLSSETNALDYIVMQLGRAVPSHTGKAGDGIYALDFTGQDSAGAFNTHYGIFSVAVDTATAGSQRGAMYFSTAGGSGGTAVGRLKIVNGLQLFDAAGANPTGADKGPGTINLPSVGGLYFDGGPSLTNNTGSAQYKMESLVGSIVISASAGVGVNATPTSSTFTSALGTFVTGTQVPTTGSGISLAGGATPVLSARDYGGAANLPLSIAASYLSNNEVAAPGSPAAGNGRMWIDSTDHRLHDKNPSGVVGTTVVADTGAANNFLTAISAAGVVSKAQPTAGGLSAAFTTTTPTPTSSGGTLTSASSSIDALQLGANSYLIVATVTITTVGTGTGTIGLTLPVTPSKVGALMGQCITNGKSIAGAFNSGSTAMVINNYDATSPIAAATYVLMGIVKV